MIATDNSGAEHYLKGMAIEAIADIREPLALFDDDEDRGLNVCPQKLLVLADSSGEENQNDKSGFLFKLTASTDTITMKLEKNGAIIATLNNSTYGTYYALGSITDYEDQSLLAGYIVEWSKVLSVSGIGDYRIQVTVVSFGSTTVQYSSCFTLKTFTTELADETIRFESYQNGLMRRTGINYKGLNFVDMIRVRGWFGNEEEEYEKTNDLFDTLEGNNRVVEQRKVNQVSVYNFETELLSKCIADRIRNYHVLANTLYVSDYNSGNYDYQLKRIRVYKDDALGFEYPRRSRKVIIKGKLKEQIQDNEKRNYF